MSTQPGTQIGRKFHTDGTAARYPGNTVIADVRRGNPAHSVMLQCLQMLEEAALDGLFISLPQESYHMTVIRGVNDRVRDEAYWPGALASDAPMAEADAYMYRAVGQVRSTGPIRMRFDQAVITEEDFRIRLNPADEAQAAELRRYRDDAAEAFGLRLPGHDAYRYHITLAYTWYLPAAEQKPLLDELVSRMNALLRAQGEVVIDPPHFAWYRDMLSFSDEPIERDD